MRLFASVGKVSFIWLFALQLFIKCSVSVPWILHESCSKGMTGRRCAFAVLFNAIFFDTFISIFAFAKKNSGVIFTQDHSLKCNALMIRCLKWWWWWWWWRKHELCDSWTWNPLLITFTSWKVKHCRILHEHVHGWAEKKT